MPLVTGIGREAALIAAAAGRTGSGCATGALNPHSPSLFIRPLTDEGAGRHRAVVSARKNVWRGRLYRLTTAGEAMLPALEALGDGGGMLSGISVPSTAIPTC